MRTPISLSEHFTFSKVYRLAIAPIIMMVFASTYSVVDGLFVSNMVGKDAFAAVNIVMPVVMLFSALGFMVGVGGTALVGKMQGQGKTEQAKKAFSSLIAFTIILGIVSTLSLYFALRPVFALFGATAETLDYCVTYSQVLCLAFVPAMLQNAFQPFFSLAGKPKVGLLITVLAGVTNMILDAVFINVLGMGLLGAALATIIGQCIGGFVPLIYFLSPNKSTLRISKFRWKLKPILNSCANGSSEFLSNVSLSIVNMIYNVKLLELLGNDGVSAYGVIMYVSTIFVMIFVGFDMALAPIVSYKYGEHDKGELKNLLKIGLITIASLSLILTVAAEASSKGLAMLFASYDQELLDLTTKAVRIYMLSFLLCGFSFFSSSWFTAVNDGLRSAIISFGRTLVFQVLAIIVLSSWLGADGIWWSIVVAETCSLVVSFLFLRGRHRYGKELYQPKRKEIVKSH